MSSRLRLALLALVASSCAPLAPAVAAPVTPDGASLAVGSATADLFTAGAVTGERRPAPKPNRFKVIAGTVIGIHSAPWQVLVVGPDSLCGGSILNATTILTAAHCVDTAIVGKPADQGGLEVVVGVSRIDQASPGDVPQRRTVSARRVHPSWARITSATGDAAVLTVPALKLDGVTARAVTLPPPGPTPVGDAIVGTGLMVTGWGVNTSGTESVDGALRDLRPTIADPDFCAVNDNAVTICGFAPSGTTCQGDSGGPVVIPPATPGASPVQVGIVSNGPVGCGAGTPDRYTNLWAPEVRAFVDGAPAPPAAPRLTLPDPDLTAGPKLQVGETVTCVPGAFTGAASVETKLTDDAGVVLASAVGGPLSFVLTPAQIGRKLGCRSYGTSAGGVAVSYRVAFTTPVVAAPPPVVTATACGQRISPLWFAEAKKKKTRRGKSQTISFYTYGMPVGAAPYMRVTGGRFRQGRKRSSTVSFGTALPSAVENEVSGLWLTMRVPKWLKRGKTYTLSWDITLRPPANTKLVCSTHPVRVRLKIAR